MGRVIICPKTGARKGAWTAEEDRLLFNYITRYGHSNWREVPKYAGILRDGKSCRLRWMNYLKPSVKRGNFTREENEVIIQMHEKLGNRWSAMAFSLPGRTDNEIKNHWHSHLKKQSKEVMIDTNIPGETKLLNGGDLMSNYCVSAQLESSPNSSGFYWPVCSPEVRDTQGHQVIKAECETSSEDVQFDGDFWNEPFLLQDSNILQDDALSFADKWYGSSVSPLEEALHPCKQQELLPFHEFGGLKAIDEVQFVFDLKEN